MTRVSVSQARREREQQELRQSILQAAQAIATEEGGWQKVSVREIANRIEYTHPAIYKYFDSKEAILLQLVRDGFTRLAQTVRTARKEGQLPQQLLLGVAKAYWQFALDNILLYQLMHNLADISFGTAQTPLEAREAFAELRETVRMVKGETVGDSLDDETDSFWAVLHGWVSLASAGRIKGGLERAEPLMLQTVNSLFGF